MDKFPHGVCECPDASSACCGGVGPVAYEVVRHGRTLRLCTHCDLSEDKPTRKLLVTRDDPFDVYATFDGLGAFCIAAELAKDDTLE